MSKKPENDFLIAVGAVMLLYTLMIAVTALEGAYHVPVWIFGVFMFISFIIISKLFKSKITELPIFLLLLFALIWVYPTTAYLFFINNSNNYEISQSFYQNEKEFINEITKSEVSLNELINIRNYLDTIRLTEPPNFIEIPERYKLDFMVIGYTGKTSLKISRGDSVESEILYYMGDPQIEMKSIVSGIERKIDQLQRLDQFDTENQLDVPYSEFWVEGIMGFRYGYITPARNITKLLNAFPTICYLLLGTLIVKFTLENKKKEVKKKKK
ncbi:MAG: hypothetical protein NXH90_15645 [Flavobacteriaceae bacterium]|nr:hypothetical protein [Flavobacteriaceae bacterium]